MKPDPSSRALNSIVRDLMGTNDGATYFASRVWGVSTHYDLGDGHPLVGRSIPNFEFENGDTMANLMHGGQGMLLDFDGNASLKTWAATYGNRMKYVSAGAKERLGLSAALVRPDGIIGWASDNHLECSGIEQAAARWFACPK